MKKCINEAVVKAYQSEEERLYALHVQFATLYAKNNRISYINMMLERDVPNYSQRCAEIAQDVEVSESLVRKFFRAVVEHTAEDWRIAP